VPYRLIGPWENETYPSDNRAMRRLSGKRITNGTARGTIPPLATDIPRGIALLITGTTVEEFRVPSQDDIAAADFYFEGGHVHTVSDAVAAILTNAGYGEYLTAL
jgi:hypothetical protein